MRASKRLRRWRGEALLVALEFRVGCKSGLVTVPPREMIILPHSACGVLADRMRLIDWPGD